MFHFFTFPFCPPSPFASQGGKSAECALHSAIEKLQREDQQQNREAFQEKAWTKDAAGDT